MEDFFKNHITKKLGEHSEDPVEHFWNILRDAVNQMHRGNDFAEKLLEIATNPDGADMSPEQFVQRSFQYRYDGIEIRKLEYGTSEGTVVQVNYRGEQEEQELQDKIAMQMANRKT
jgi:hypothetical protein